MTEWAKLAERMGYPDAAKVVAAADGMSQQRLFAEILIAFAAGRMAESSSIPCIGSIMYDMLPIAADHVGEGADIPFETDDKWLLEGMPEGTVVPPPSGRTTVRTPNLNSANPSFAALLIRHVRDKFNGDAAQVYRAACVSRQTYSSIISNELRPVSKGTAVQFALALHLTLDETNEFLRAAGHALSKFLLEDIIYQACIAAGIYDVAKVDEILRAHGVGRSDEIPF